MSGSHFDSAPHVNPNVTLELIPLGLTFADSTQPRTLNQQINKPLTPPGFSPLWEDRYLLNATSDGFDVLTRDRVVEDRFWEFYNLTDPGESGKFNCYCEAVFKVWLELCRYYGESLLYGCR